MKPTIPFVLVASLYVSTAFADGETSPMLGGAIVAGTSVQDSATMAGVELEAAWWYRWLGVAFEVSGVSSVDADRERSRAMVVGGSLRLRLTQTLMRSLLEPSDVEFGLELHGIVERTVWDRENDDTQPIRRGFGIAVRLRGSTDDDAPRLITESRLFVRILEARPSLDGVLARSTMPMPHDPRDVMVIIGLGAAFGGGEPRYLAQFRRRFEPTLLRP